MRDPLCVHSHGRYLGNSDLLQEDVLVAERILDVKVADFSLFTVDPETAQVISHLPDAAVNSESRTVKK